MASVFRNANWLKNNGFGAQVFLFRNIESGQVLYSQLPHVQKYQIKQQSFRPNWENKKPTKRRDLWRTLAVANFQSYGDAIRAYHGLVELRYMREISKRKEAEALRKRNQFQQMWYFGQYRPGYQQEAVADLSCVIDEFKLSSKIYWETLWHKGDDKYWNLDYVEHFEINEDHNVSPRERYVVLDELRKLNLQQLQENGEGINSNSNEAVDQILQKIQKTDELSQTA